MIEFYLPTANKSLRDLVKSTIEIRLCIWADKHKVNFTGKVQDDKLLIEFSEEKDYTLFMLTWDRYYEWKMLKNI